MKNENNKSKFLMIKNKFFSYITSARFSGWLLISVFFLLGEWYSAEKILLYSTIIALFGFGAIFSAGFMINNLSDMKVDIFAGKPFVKAFKYVSPKEMLFTATILSIIGLIILWYININQFLVGLSIVIIGILYSVPPIRLKTRPPFDGICNALGVLPFFSGWMIVGNPINFLSIIYGLILGLAVLSYYFLYTSLDIKMDKELGIVTSCVKLGLNLSILTGISIFLISFLLSFIYLGIPSIITISFIICLPFVILTAKIQKDRKTLSTMVGGRIFTLWVGVTLLILSVSSRDLIPIFLFGIILFLTLFEVYYLIQKRKKHESSKYYFYYRKFKAYLMAARMPAVSILFIFFILGSWYSIRDFPVISSVLILIFLVCYQFIHGLTNMAFDKKLDIFSRKNIMFVFKYISSKEMLISSLIFSIIGLIIIFYINFFVFIIGLILILITLAYAMPPIRLKIHPPFDSIANALEFGTLPFFMGWMITNNSLTLTSIIYGIIMGISTVPYYLIISWQDIKIDKDFGINTSCTKLGYNGTIYTSIFVWIFVLVLAIIFFSFSSLITLTFLAVLPFILLTGFIYKKASSYQSRVIILQFCSGILVTVWADIILISIMLLTYSLIPVIILIIVVLYNHVFLFKSYIKHYQILIKQFNSDVNEQH